ncbi:MAG: S-DNA-T family DNA segregation ATPase FtsK/SpoIIIE [Phycisphaerales bacterium]|jgi:S-DNA-T family DNA segregation ATPase FtsK/SpoIIIE
MATKKTRPYKVTDKNRAQEPTPTAMLWRRLGWLTLTGVWAFVALALISFDAGDTGRAVFPHNDPTQNLAGSIGATISYGLLQTFGLSVVVAMAFTGVWLWLSASGRPIQQPLLRTAGAGIITASVAGLLQVMVRSVDPLPGMAGGTVGVALVDEVLLPAFNTLGTVLTLGVALLIGLIVACDELVFAVPRAILNASKPAAAKAGQATIAAGRVAGTGAGVGAKHAGTGLWAGLARVVRRTKTVRVHLNDVDEPVEIEVARGRKRGAAAGAAVEAKPKRRRRAVELEEDETEELDEAAVEYEDATEEEDEYEDDVYDEDDGDDEYEEGEEDEEEVGAPQVFDRDALKEKIAALPVRFAQSQKSTTTAEDLMEMQNAAELEGYIFPGLDLLEEPEEGFNAKLEELVREQAESLESSLREYNIKGHVVDIESGPAITLYHVKLAPGTKVSQLTAVSSDLARSLKAVNIRIVSNMKGRSTVGIEVPNPTRERVRLKELMGNQSLFSKMKLPMFLGKDAAGDPLIYDLTKMPHMLIAGTTGSGKSVCMNTIIMSFLYTKKPNELKLILVDPKMVEMSQFKDIPHLMCPVVTEMSKAAAILEWAMTKMDERYELLVEAGCRDISSYNNLEFDELIERMTPSGRELSEEQKARIPRKLPYMVFVIDELADLMMTNKEVEGSIIRIAQKARAVGIHMILATQRPQANVVTGLIKANMPCRVAFKVSSGMDSRIVLDQKGGELLLGQGDMLYLNPSSHELQRAQGTLVDDHEIRAVTRFLKEVAGPNYERQLLQMRGAAGGDEEKIFNSENHSSASLAAAQEDPMFDRAVEIVLETKRGSVSLLQRRLAIGYTRSSRLIDLMGIAGIISDHKGSVARDVLITEDEWAAIKALAEEEAGGDQMLLTGDEEGEASAESAPFAVAGDEVEAEDDDEEGEEYEEEEEEKYEEADEAEDGEEEYEEEEVEEDAEAVGEDDEEDADAEEDEDVEEDVIDEDEEDEEEAEVVGEDEAGEVEDVENEEEEEDWEEDDSDKAESAA